MTVCAHCSEDLLIECSTPCPLTGEPVHPDCEDI